MSVLKIEKNNNYTVMLNYYLRDKNLSYKAKGLLLLCNENPQFVLGVLGTYSFE